MHVRQRIATTALCCGLAAGVLAIDSIAPITAHAAPAYSVATPVGDNLAGRAQWAAVNTTADRYVTERDSIATEVAGRLGLDAAAMRAAWSNADLRHQVALLSALGQMGVPYRRNTSKPGVGFDCSGLTTFAWAQVGVSITRQSAAQIRQSAARTVETAQAGDLVYYPGHVMMWLGVDYAIVHSPNTGSTVEVSFVGKRKIKRVRFGDPTVQS
jgi:cell wall-associated NlpC family hydrolase